MFSFKKWTLPLVAAAMVCVGFTAANVRADDAAAPAMAGKGTITGTVTKDGQPMANAEVRLMVPKGMAGKKPATQPTDAAAPAAGKGGKNEAIMTATTDDKGMFTLNDVPEGTYNVAAGIKGQGMGRAKVDVKAGETETVTITASAMKKN